MSEADGSMEPEIRPIPGCVDYFASSDGVIWFGRGGPKRRLKGQVHRTYLYVTVRCSDEKRRRKSVHSLIALAFIGPRPDKMLILHGNGNPIDNRASNLRYGTSRDNSDDAASHGTLLLGSKKPAAKLTEADVRTCRRLAIEGALVSDISKDYPTVSYTSICDAVRGRTFRHVTDPPPVATVNENRMSKQSSFQARGERNGLAKTTADSVLAMRQAFLDGALIRDIARDSGLADKTVRNILAKKSWRHVEL